jgi:phosphoribosylformylglycinamidine synthase
VSTAEGTATANPVPPRDGDPEITSEVVADHGLSPEEYERVEKVMGRTPTFTELGVFSAMWSEHCGYKNSKRLLRLLPTKAPWVIQGPGENAGVIDVGDGYALAFKIESHNHPSAVEPYQGAATGVGGILRDIFTMGARPVAILDSLRFGDLDSGRVRYLFGGVVSGVGDYGNCIGVPNVGGEVVFDRGYEGNPIVNAMCLGLMKHEDLITASASGLGSPIMAVGARTGRDGIHGATFASEELSEDSDESSRPQVQVGDPFTEKLLLEASLELIASGAISGIQDMGAAGITSSASEMAGRGGSGVEMEMTDVPIREQGMTPYEILLSESQERMLVVAKTGREHEVHAILEKWELESAVIGRVTDDGMFRILENGKVVADIPALPLTEGCPTYEREGIESEEIKALREMDLAEHLIPEGDLTKSFLMLLGSPNVASKQWIYHQYDTTVRTATAVRPGGDSGVIRIRGTNRAVAATTDCNGRFVYLEPQSGAMGAVAEAARNLVCVGATPTAITNNLNFGNPLKAHIYYQMREAVLGMRDACNAFETPVTGGNVSLFNETDGAAIYPTPVIGMVGVIDDVSKITPQPFQNLQGERMLQQAVLLMNHEGLLTSAHDCSDGGLASALAECALGNGEAPLGVEAELDDQLRPVVALFGESHGRIIVSCAQDKTEEVLRLAERHDVPARRIGRVAGEGEGFVLKVRDGVIKAPIAELADAYFGAIPKIMDATPPSGD